MKSKCIIPWCNNEIIITKEHFNGKLDVCEECRNQKGVKEME